MRVGADYDPWRSAPARTGVGAPSPRRRQAARRVPARVILRAPSSSPQPAGPAIQPRPQTKRAHAGVRTNQPTQKGSTASLPPTSDRVLHVPAYLRRPPRLRATTPHQALTSARCRPACARARLRLPTGDSMCFRPSPAFRGLQYTEGGHRRPAGPAAECACGRDPSRGAHSRDGRCSRQGGGNHISQCRQMCSARSVHTAVE